MPDAILGVMGTLAAILLCLFTYIVTSNNIYSDLREQCETQGSIRLHSTSGKALFYCSREKSNG
jgi:hypothetical protein